MYDSSRLRKAFHPLDFLAELTQHIPNHYEHRVFYYYGAYSSKRRGVKSKEEVESQPQMKEKEPTQSRKACHSAWAKLISKVCQTDPLACPRCKNPMKIVAFIEEDEPVKAILKHFHLWDYPRRAPPKKIPLPQEEGLRSPYSRDEIGSTLKHVAETWEPYTVDPEIPADAYFHEYIYA